MANSVLDDIYSIEKEIQTLHAEAVMIKSASAQMADDIVFQRSKVESDYQATLSSLASSDQQINANYKQDISTSNSSLSRAKNNFDRVLLEQISIIQKKYDTIVKNDKSYIKWLNEIIGRLPDKLVKKYSGKASFHPKSKPNLDKIRKLDQMINTDTAESFAKKLACVSGYYHQGDMQKDLIFLAVEAKYYLGHEILQAQNNCQVEIASARTAVEGQKQQSVASASSSEVYAGQKRQKALQANQLERDSAAATKKKTLEVIAVDEQKNQEKISSMVSLANQHRKAFFSSDLVTGFQDRMLKSLLDTGALLGDWECSIDRTPAKQFSFCNAHVPVRTESKSLLDILARAIPKCFVRTDFIVPLLLENECATKLFLQYDNGTKKTAYENVQLFIIQKMRSNPANRLQIYFADPNDRGQNLGILIASKEVNEAIGIRTENTRDGIKNMLNDVVTHIDEMNGELGEYTSLYEYNRKSGGVIKETILVLCDVQSCIEQDTVAQLKVIWENAKRCGINVILSSESHISQLGDYYPNARIDWGFLNDDNTYSFICVTNNAYISTSNFKYYYYERETIGNQHKTFLNEYRKNFAKSLKIENSFSKLRSKMLLEMETEDQRHFGKAYPGIKLPIFVDTVKNAICKDFILGTENSQHMLITGGTGSGKSRLLHSIIVSIVMNYHPDDVELWLVDCKKVEFEMFMHDRPEHIRIVSLERSKEFAYAFFDYLLEFAQNRTKLLTKANVNNIKDYRKALNDPYCMPRVVIIIDEFHAITEHLTQDFKYRQLLEDALSEYRNLGISFIFSDQSVSGLKGLTEKSRQQIHYRIAMRGNIGEMKETLSVLNDNYTSETLTAMENSEGRGDSWWNKNLKTKYKNIYISNERKIDSKGQPTNEPTEEQLFFAEAINKKSKAKQDTRVILVDGNSRIPISYEDIKSYIHLCDTVASVKFCLGTPTTLDENFGFNLVQKYNHNVLITGRDDVMSVDVLLAMLKSIDATGGIKTVIFADASDEKYSMLVNHLRIAHLNDVKCYDNYDEMCCIINELHSVIKSKKLLEDKIVVIWLGLSDMYDEFCISPAKSADANSERKSNEAKVNGGFIIKDVNKALDDPQLMEMANAMGITVEQALVFLSDDVDKSLVLPNDKSLCYNATQDMLDMFAMGGKYGLFNIVTLDYSYDMKHIKGFNLNNFIHKIAFCMPRDESIEWGYRSVASELTEGLTALYTDGINQRIFKPYIDEGDVKK